MARDPVYSSGSQRSEFTADTFSIFVIHLQEDFTSADVFHPIITYAKLTEQAVQTHLKDIRARLIIYDDSN